MSDEHSNELLAKLYKLSIPLSEYAKGKIFRGIVTGFNEAFVIDANIKQKLISENSKSTELIKPFLLGRDVKRYHPVSSELYLIFARHGIDITKYPAIDKHLHHFREELMPRPKNWKGIEWKGRKPGSYQWYEVQDTIDYYIEFEKPKIIYPNICKKPEFTFDDSGLYTNQKCFIISLSDKYLLGILNSSIAFFLFKLLLPKLRGNFYEPSYVYFKNFPIRTINFSDPSDKARHNQMVERVDRMLSLHKQLATAKTSHDKTSIQRQIDPIDQQIDQLVYELYRLTGKEIKIIEEGAENQ